MKDTQYSRRLDSLGRLVIPKKLRDTLGLVTGEEYTFYQHEHNGQCYLCIPVAGEAMTEIEQAKQILAEAGYEIGERA